MKTSQLTLIGTILAVSALSIPMIINETSPKPEMIDESTYMLSIDPLQRVLEHCESQRKLATGEIPERNADGSFNGIDLIGLYYSNDTHYIDNNTCKWQYVGPATNSINKWGGAPMYQKQNKSVGELLAENNVDYLQDKLVVTRGLTLKGDPGCGAVISTDLQTHWFGIDSVSNPTKMTLFSENPHQCMVNTSSCFCNAQIELASITLDELIYFTPIDQQKYSEILIGYLYDENINRTPKFQIGKLNLNYTDSSAIGYCGHVWGTNTYGFFSGAIVNDIVEDYRIEKESPSLCAISEDAEWWENEN